MSQDPKNDQGKLLITTCVFSFVTPCQSSPADLTLIAEAVKSEALKTGLDIHGIAQGYLGLPKRAPKASWAPLAPGILPSARSDLQEC